jgi:DNA repair protein RecO (recombination protein O)
MLNSTKGIVLYRQKYSDSSSIVRIYTEKFGKQAYLIYGTGSKKSKSQSNLLQPLFILDLTVYHKPEGTLQKVKEFSASAQLHSLPNSIQKTTISFFLAEMIDKILKENQPDTVCFEFIEKSIQILDLLPQSVSNFHLIFLFQWSRYLGFFPENNFSESKQIFDMVAGKFITGIPQHPHYLNAEKSRLFFSIFQIGLNVPQTLKINSEERNELLDFIIEYYNLHLEKTGKIKSLDVLRNVFV